MPDKITVYEKPTCTKCREMDKLQDLYESLAEARRESGEDAIPFHKFADLIKTQVSALKAKGTPEVAFRVAVKHGKVAFTARPMKGTMWRSQCEANGMSRTSTMSP